MTIEREKKEYELSVRTGESKEVIKAEISQELTKAKELFEKFDISEASESEIKNKIEKK